MPRLSWNQIQVLAHAARWNYGREANIYRFKRHIDARSIRVLIARNLLEFNPLFGRFNPTPSGEKVLVDHGFNVAGQWQGSNSPGRH